jgi:hypothetical protein
MEKLPRSDLALLMWQVFSVAFFLTSGLIYLWQQEFQGMFVMACGSGLMAVFTLINIDKWTEKGTKNNEFFNQHVF